MPQEGIWAWDTDNNVWVKIKTDSQGRLYTVAVIDELNDIGDVEVAAPGDGEALVWDNAAGDWVAAAPVPAAHKDSHDPQDGSDPLDAAAPVKVGSANAEGSSHSLARADHVHEREHAKYTDSDAQTTVKANVKLNELQAPDGAVACGAQILDNIGAPSDAGDALRKGTALTITEMPANMKLATITFIIDGGGSAITTGIKGDLEIPFACTINQVTMLASPSGSIVVDIWKQAYADFPPEDAQSITASAVPTITTAEKSQDSTLTGWTTAISAGDCLRFYVDSITTIERVTISLKVTKT